MVNSMLYLHGRCYIDSIMLETKFGLLMFSVGRRDSLMECIHSCLVTPVMPYPVDRKTMVLIIRNLRLWRVTLVFEDAYDTFRNRNFPTLTFR